MASLMKRVWLRRMVLHFPLPTLAQVSHIIPRNSELLPDHFLVRHPTPHLEHLQVHLGTRACGLSV